MKFTFSNAKSLAYLFVIDLVRQQHHSFSTYDKEEKGYANAWLEAYIEAFDYSNDGRVTHDLLKMINSTAMAWNGTKDQGYKREHNNISMYFSDVRHNGRDVYNSSYSTSFDGIKEFLTYWFINQASTTHLIGFMDWNQTKPNCYGVKSYNKDNSTFEFVTNIQGVCHTQHLSFEEVLQTLKPIVEAGRITNVTMDGFETLAEEEIPAATEFFAQKIMDEYHQAMSLAESDNDKITAIAELVQRLDQLHPFLDGNVRVCYILMNKLLRDNQLGFSLVVNPNRFDGCSTAEITHMIKDGQALFQTVLASLKEENAASLELISTAIKSSLNPLSCPPQTMAGVSDRLIEQFYQAIGIELHKPQNTVGFFDNATPATLPAYLIGPMDNAQYGLAFRRACAKADSAETILMVIEQAAGAIDVTETSSNGKSASDWLSKNSLLTLKDKRIINQEISKMLQSAPPFEHFSDLEKNI